MGKKYLELNKKMRLAAILKIVAFGLSPAAAVFAVVVAVYKLSGNQPNFMLASLIGIGVAVIATALSAFIIRPTEAVIAKKLDNRLSLNEKVQTMFEFKDTEGEMLEIQREDTERILNEATKKSLRSKNSWVSILASALAVVMLVTAIILPVRTLAVNPENPVEGESDEWELDDWHISAVRALIEEVKESKMVDDGKNEVVGYLETLIDELPYVKSKSQMKKKVSEVMVKISAVSDKLNSYSAIIKALRESDSEDVRKFAEAIGSPSDPIIESKYQAFIVSFKKESADNAKARAVEAKPKLEPFARALEIAVKASNIPETDAFYTTLISFTESVKEFALKSLEMTDDEFETVREAMFAEAAQSIGTALNIQSGNRETSDNTNNRLMIIFGISWAELPDELKYQKNEEAGTENGDYDDKEDEDIVTGGGLGGGDVIYGSDDAIYDPENDAHVKYGDVLNDYDAKKATELEERPLDDDMKDFIGAYFDSLYHKKEK